MKVKILGLNVQVDWLIKLLMDLLAQVVDKLVPGEELSNDQKRGIRTFYFLGWEWGKDAVESTDTELDDEGLEKLLAACEDTANEGGFTLPVVN